MTWGEFKERINREVCDTDKLDYIEVFNFDFIVVSKEKDKIRIET
jgi:hypothetical protein